MENTTLIRVTGIVLVICVISITAILIWYPGTSAEKLLAAGVIAGLITIIGGQFANYKQSSENATSLAVIAPKVDQAVAAVAENTALTEQAVENVDIIHKSVNSELAKWKQSVVDKSAQDQVIWEERSKNLIADALAEGLRRGRVEAETTRQDTVIEAANVARVAAETATEAARVVVDAAATAAAVLKDAPRPAETQADGTILVEAPAVIQVVAPAGDAG